MEIDFPKKQQRQLFHFSSKMDINFEDLIIRSIIATGEYGTYIDVKVSGEDYCLKVFGYSDLAPDVSWIQQEILVMNALQGRRGVPQLVTTFNDSDEGLIRMLLPKQHKDPYPMILLRKSCQEEIDRTNDIVKSYKLSDIDFPHTFTFDDFSVEGILGKGAFGLVREMKLKANGSHLFACKFFGYTGRPIKSEIFKEILTMKALTGIVGTSQIFGVFEDSKRGLISGKTEYETFPIILMEKIGGKTILDWFCSHFQYHQKRASAAHSTNESSRRPAMHPGLECREFSEKSISRLFREIMISLNSVHDMGIIINDIKNDNVMIEENGNVKLVDFGLAVMLAGRDRHFDTKLHGNPVNLAPETIRKWMSDGHGVYSKASDIWQVGCLLYSCLFAWPPFGIEYLTKTEQRIATATDYDKLLESEISLGVEWHSEFFTPYGGAPNISPQVRDLLTKMLALDPTQRITGPEFLMHPWIAEHEKYADDTPFGSEYLARIKRLTNRQELRKKFTQVREKFKDLALALHTTANAANASSSTTPTSSTSSTSLVASTGSETQVAPDAELRRFEISYGNVERVRTLFMERFPDVAPAVVVAEKMGVDRNVFFEIFKEAGIEPLASNEQATHEVFDLLDQNKDGTIDYCELLLALVASYKHEELLTTDELGALYFLALDIDGSKMITFEEFNLVMCAMFDMEQEITPEDFEAMAPQDGVSASPLRGRVPSEGGDDIEHGVKVDMFQAFMYHIQSTRRLLSDRSLPPAP